MTIDVIREYCLSKPCVTEEFPFDETTLVFKVYGKMFLLTDMNPPLSISIKCDPEIAIGLREYFECVTPGYHLNKKHWNMVILDSSVSWKIICGWIDDSYRLVTDTLPVKIRRMLRKKK